MGIFYHHRRRPEFETTPFSIGFHLAAEMSTALIIGGMALLKPTIWGKPILLVGLGMVMYSEIVVPLLRATKSMGHGCYVCPPALRYNIGCYVSVEK